MAPLELKERALRALSPARTELAKARDMTTKREVVVIRVRIEDKRCRKMHMRYARCLPARSVTASSAARCYVYVMFTEDGDGD